MFNQWNIQALRGVGNVELRFNSDKQVRVLFGSNGVGKTKCLEAIFQACLLSNKMFSEELSGGVYQNGWQVVASLEVEDGIIFKAPQHHAVIKTHAPLRENVNRFEHEKPIVFLGASGRSKVDAVSPYVELIGTFHDRKRKYFESLLSAITAGAMSDIGMATNTQSWFVSRASSANPYQKHSDSRNVEIEAVLGILHSIDSRIDPKELRIDGAGNVSLLIDGDYRELKQLSSGFASLTKLVQAIVSGYANFTNESNLSHVSGMVLIDEIESHLHAEWQSKIIPTLKSALPNTTFYIATHSPIVLSQLEDGEAYRLIRNNDGVVRSSKISSPNKRIFADVLESAFDVDLNALKRKGMEFDDQSEAKRKLHDLIKREGAG
jgi:predicted ATP-binding protein involved in virulence